jgi:hypothetical protein
MQVFCPRSPHPPQHGAIVAACGPGDFIKDEPHGLGLRFTSTFHVIAAENISSLAIAAVLL